MNEPSGRCRRKRLERVMGFEPTTFCLGSRYSTPELHPLVYSLSINFISKSRVGNIIGNGSEINLPQSFATFGT